MEIRDLLVVAASVAFVLILMWRFRPQFSHPEHDGPMPKKLVAQLDAATAPAAKSALLFEAGTQALAALRYGSAENYFRRALRVEPESTELIVRVVAALQRRPRGLEAMLWRRLSEARYQGPERAASLTALGALIRLYDRLPKQRTKAAALRHVLRQIEPNAPEAMPPASETDVSA